MSDENMDSTPSNDSLAASLVSPNTERAVEDIIRNSSGNGVVSQTNGANGGVAMRGAPPPGDDNFENLQKAVQILARAKTLDEQKQYDDALKMYRQGVDMLLEELIVRQGTEQSRTYLREKCNDFMNRIDQLKMIIQIEKANENKENQTAVAWRVVIAKHALAQHLAQHFTAASPF